MKCFSPITNKDLADKIIKAFKSYGSFDYENWKEDYGQSDDSIKAIMNCTGYGIPWTNLTPSVAEDLKTCEFDLENVDCKNGYCNNVKKITGFKTIESTGLTYLGISAGGDWESPVFFIIYYDGKELRGYIPLNGNPWNTDEKQAYGNNESDNDNAQKRFNVNNYEEAEADPKLIIEEIKENIIPKGMVPKSTTKNLKLTEDFRTRVEFARGSSLKNRRASWPWYWNIIVQNGHPYASSKCSFDTFEQCMEDFNKNGKNQFDKIQKELSGYEIPARNY